MTTDMTHVIQPKSDQLNSDALLTGPITISITEVSIRPGTEQPISVHYEGDNGKPWKPCKTTARQLVAAWGPDASQYAGRSATLYLDPEVVFGGMKVGGIRLSHLSHIERDMVMAFTASKGKKKPLTVKPLKADVAPLKVVEPEPAGEAFDIDAFEAEVQAQVERGTEALADWWESVKAERIKAGQVDRARAVAMREAVDSALAGDV